MRVEASTELTATPEQVWTFISVPENGPRWQESAISTRMTTPGPVSLGSEMEHLGRWLRLRVPTHAVVTVFEPPFRFGYDITSRLSAGPSLMRYVIEPAGRGSRLTLSNEARIAGWMKPIEGFLQRNVQAMFERDVARLKATLEARVGSNTAG